MGGGKLVWMFDGDAPAGTPPAFAPTDISGIVLWLDANQIVGLANADPVVTWSDLSGQGNHVTQATVGKQPTYRTGVINGLPVVRSDGVDDILVKATPAGINVSSGNLFVVFKTSSGAQSHDLVASCDEATTATYVVLFRVITRTTQRLEIAQSNNDTFDVINGGTTIGQTNFQLAEWSSSGTAYIIRYNGTPETLTVTGGANAGDWFADTPNRDNLTVCGSKWDTEDISFAGDLAEIVMYDNELSAPDRTLMNAYFATKYGLTIA